MYDVEVFVVVDSAGDYACGVSIDAARERYEEDVQSLADAEGFRVVKCTLKVALPECVVLSGTAPANGLAELTMS